MPAPDISLGLVTTVVFGILSVFGVLLRYIWRETKNQIEGIVKTLDLKADSASIHSMETRLNADIKRVEDRQNRDLEGLRQEMQAMERRISEKIDMVVQLLRGQ